jgi:peptidyl-prolyl cis-trans isomerase C
LLSCGSSEDKPFAKMGDQVLTTALLKQHYLSISPEARPDLATIDEQEQFARDVVSKEILVAEAYKMGLEKLPEVTQAVSSATQRKAWEVFYRENVRSKVQVTEEEVRALYDKQRYTYHLLWIFLRSKAQADEVAARLAAGEDFEKLAGIYSMDPSRQKGGDIGARPLGTLPEAVEDMVSKMSPGDVSAPAKYDSYYVIIKLVGKEEQQPQDFAVARPGLEAMIRNRKENALQRKLAADLRKKYELTFNTDALETIARKTRELYSSEDVKIGLIPEFTDEELARDLADFKGGEWLIRTYAEKIKMQPPSMRPGYGTNSETIKSVIEDFITGELWMVEIQNEGYTTRPEVVDLVNRVREEAVITALHDQLVRDVTVSDTTLANFYQEEKSQLVSEATVLLGVITTETEEEANEIYGLLRAGESFEDLARERSFDRASGENGGTLRGQIPDKQLEMFPDVYALITGMKIGAYSAPVPMPMGLFPGNYAIFRVIQRTPAKQLTLDEVRTQLSEKALQYEQDKVFGQWLADKMEEYGVEVYPEALEAINWQELKETQE